MITISTEQTLQVDENILERIREILSASQEYDLLDIVKSKLIINTSSDNTMIEYDLAVPKVFFEEFPHFQMKLFEKGFSRDSALTETHLVSYSYNGFHRIPNVNPSKDHFIRFDFEPFKKNHAPVHINTPQEWGDHLIYPDNTNLDISNMNCATALKVFHRYAKDIDDYPVNQKTNQEYAAMFKKGGNF